MALQASDRASEPPSSGGSKSQCQAVDRLAPALISFTFSFITRRHAARGRPLFPSSKYPRQFSSRAKSLMRRLTSATANKTSSAESAAGPGWPSASTSIPGSAQVLPSAIGRVPRNDGKGMTGGTPRCLPRAERRVDIIQPSGIFLACGGIAVSADRSPLGNRLEMA